MAASTGASLGVLLEDNDGRSGEDVKALTAVQDHVAIVSPLLIASQAQSVSI